MRTSLVSPPHLLKSKQLRRKIKAWLYDGGQVEVVSKET
jgi:hypothetical protein